MIFLQVLLFPPTVCPFLRFAHPRTFITSSHHPGTCIRISYDLHQAIRVWGCNNANLIHQLSTVIMTGEAWLLKLKSSKSSSVAQVWYILQCSTFQSFWLITIWNREKLHLSEGDSNSCHVRHVLLYLFWVFNLNTRDHFTARKRKMPEQQYNQDN